MKIRMEKLLSSVNPLDSNETKSRRVFDALKSYKIPLLSLVLFSSMAIKALYPDSMLWGKRGKSYRFRGNTLGFFMGDLSLFQQSSADEAELQMVNLFPEKLRPRVTKVIRPVLILCEKYQVDPFWALSILWTESHFRFHVTSKKGAHGLMQVMPETYQAIMEDIRKSGQTLESDRGEDYLVTTYGEHQDYSLTVKKLRNLEAGIFYLRKLLESFDYNHYHATIAYNMGPSWTRKRLESGLPLGKKNQYLNKVVQAYFHLSKNHSHNANVTSFIQRYN